MEPDSSNIRRVGPKALTTRLLATAVRTLGYSDGTGSGVDIETISHYRIVRRLGAGGMGEVWLARDTKLGRDVALKFLLPGGSSDARSTQRFLREARAAAMLHHPGIAHIYEIGEAADGRTFIAMEYVEGQTLDAILRSRRLPIAEILRVAAEVAGALDEAHRAGIVHRDIKPANVIVTPRAQVKVLDFGLAKVTASDGDVDASTATQVLTGTGVILGTVAYMSPEQALGREVDHRSDLFSLGVLLYEMVAGRRPFTGATAAETLDHLLHERPPALTQSNSEAPPELQRIVAKCLEKEPERRYQSVTELVADLRNLLRDLGADGGTRERATPAPTRRRLGLVALVLGVAIAGGSAALAWLGSRSDAIDSVAVFPFANASRDPNLEYLADGITETLINRLSQMPSVRVVPRTTVYRYKGKDLDPNAAGQALGVRAVVVGRVIQRGATLSIRAELIDVERQSQLWGEHYERDVAELLSVEDEIASAVAEKLRVELDPRERTRLTRRYTDSAQAHQLYLRGRYVWNKRTEEGIRKGIEYFRQAIEADPGYSLAYAGLADCYNFLGAFGIAVEPPGETMPKARAAAMKALELDESLAEAHASLGFAKLYYDWDFDGAEREFRRAIELRPDYAPAHQWYSHLLVARGRTEEGLAAARRALRLDPLSLIANMNLGWQHHWSRQPDQAIEQLRKTLDMERRFEQGRWGLGLAYEQKGMSAEAASEFRAAAELSGGLPVFVASLGHALAMSGDREAAAKVRDDLRRQASTRYVPPYWMATLSAGMADRDEAFRWLEQAYTERSGGLVWAKVYSRLDPLRADPRFDALLRRVGH